MLMLVETDVFARQVGAFWMAEEFRQFQWYLLQHPESGALIRGSGGFRKVRWGREGRGKSSGVRGHLLLRDRGRSGST